MSYCVLSPSCCFEIIPKSIHYKEFASVRLVYYTSSVASPALIYRPFVSLSSIHLDSLFIVSPQNYCHAQ